MQILKQSTAITAKIGPFIDETDGKTAETGLTIAQADVRLSKNGGDIAQKTEATSCTHDELGIYGCPLDTTDTGTLGRLQLWVHSSGALPVWHEYMVVTANVWDSLCGADKLDVNTAELANIDFGATMKASINTEVDNALNTAIPGSPTANSVNERVATMDDAYTATRAGYLDELAAANIPADLDAALADTNELQTDWTNGGRLDLIIDAIVADTGELQTDWANGGRLDLLVDAIKTITDTLTLAAIADAIWDELMSGHATSDSAGLAVDNLLKIGKNKWGISGTTLTIYDDDGTSTLYSFTLDSGTSPTVRTPI
ncbi:MAG: hypothetical protein OEZ40_01630 [Candidatus Bathyarchaeota archaeon]|nr:hypothetical protein [Candidatus Bathyarchaeota archaeon]